MTTPPKRFYRTVSVEGAPPAVRVLLDGKPIRTPAKRELALPSRALAEAVAAEWEAQGDQIDPAAMPLTRLINSALDGVTGREAEVVDVSFGQVKRRLFARQRPRCRVKQPGRIRAWSL